MQLRDEQDREEDFGVDTRGDVALQLRMKRVRKPLVSTPKSLLNTGVPGSNRDLQGSMECLGLGTEVTDSESCKWHSGRESRHAQHNIN